MSQMLTDSELGCRQQARRLFAKRSGCRRSGRRPEGWLTMMGVVPPRSAFIASNQLGCQRVQAATAADRDRLRPVFPPWTARGGLWASHTNSALVPYRHLSSCEQFFHTSSMERR